MSIVPYDNSVNNGHDTCHPRVRGLTNEHNYSRCGAVLRERTSPPAAIKPSVAAAAAWVIFRTRDTNWWADPIRSPACHTDDTAAIMPWSNDEGRPARPDRQPAGQRLDRDRPMALRWAVALLDPAARPALSGLSLQGRCTPDFDGRPAAYNDEETLKVIVLMDRR